MTRTCNAPANSRLILGISRLAMLAAAFFAAMELAAEPVCQVRREVYVPSPQPGVTPCVSIYYLGNGLRQREIRNLQSKSDLGERTAVRFSDDNGRTWTPVASAGTAPDSLRQGDTYQADITFAVNYDPASRQTVEMICRRIFLGEPGAALKKLWQGERKFYDHMFYRLSGDEGRNWTQESQLAYESGPAFDPKDWANPAFLRANDLYGSYDITLLRSGQIAYPATLQVARPDDDEDRKVCANVPKYTAPVPGYVAGVTCFLGTWNSKKKDYDWTHSTPVSVPRHISTRGLLEPAIAELKDGRLLLDMRGSNDGLDPVKYPGRQWISLSDDDGKHWSPATDLRYDTGEQFYAPSTFARFIRSHKTGELYWIGNISRERAKGNRPRYPLYIAEVNEQKAALKKDSLTIIDDRGPGDTDKVQFSNFSLLENRETLDLEVLLSRYGEHKDNTFSANAYKYILTFH